MKLVILFLMFFSTVAFAEAPKNWFPVGKSGATTIYAMKAKCEAVEGQSCFDITGKDPRYHTVQTVQVDDMSKPIWKAPYNSGACDDALDCAAKIGAAQSSDPCDSGDAYKYEENKLLPGWTYFCSKLLGYEQIETQSLVEDAGLKTSIQAADTAKAQQAAAEDAVFKNMAFGKRLKAKIAVINLTRGLTEVQVKDFVDTFESINRLLDAGAIQTARSNINGLVPDEVLLRQVDKDKILAEIDAYLAP